jgi:hypothetical protein
MRRRRVRTWAKWACTLAAVAAVGVAVASRFYRFGVTVAPPTEFPCWHIHVRAGLLTVHREVTPEFSYDGTIVTQWYFHRNDAWSWGLGGLYELPSSGVWRAGMILARDSCGWIAGLSLVYPVLLTTIPAAFLWYNDRRRSSPHTCPNCNYDRRGLPAQANCPECGTTPARG